MRKKKKKENVIIIGKQQKKQKKKHTHNHKAYAIRKNIRATSSFKECNH